MRLERSVVAMQIGTADEAEVRRRKCDTVRQWWLWATQSVSAAQSQISLQTSSIMAMLQNLNYLSVNYLIKLELSHQVHNFKLAVLDATRIDGIPLLAMMPPADRDLFARRRSRRDLP